GFPIGLRPEAPFSRNQVIAFLENRKIATRLLFAGNLTRQPAYFDVPHRTIGTLDQTDYIMNRVFWVGVYPGLSSAMISYILETLLWANEKLRLGVSVCLLTRDSFGFRRRVPHLAMHEAVQLHDGDVRTFEFPPGQFSHVIHAAGPITRQNEIDEIFPIIVEG